MSSNAKPATGGLAALLRADKERKQREEEEGSAPEAAQTELGLAEPQQPEAASPNELSAQKSVAVEVLLSSNNSQHEVPDEMAPTAVSRKRTDASLLSTAIQSFAEFRKRWARFLTEAQLGVCELIYKNTVAKNENIYETTVSDIGAVIEKSERHTRLILSQLVEMGFISKRENKQSNRTLGIKLSFHVNPLTK